MTVLLHLALRLIILFSATCWLVYYLGIYYAHLNAKSCTLSCPYYLCAQIGDVHIIISLCPFFSSVYLWPLQIFLGIWWGSRRWRRRQGGWRGDLSPVPIRSGLTSCLQNVWDRASRWLIRRPLLRCFSAWLGWSFRTCFQNLSLWRRQPMCNPLCTVEVLLGLVVSDVRVLAKCHGYSFMSSIHA